MQKNEDNDPAKNDDETVEEKSDDQSAEGNNNNVIGQQVGEKGAHQVLNSIPITTIFCWLSWRY